MYFLIRAVTLLKESIKKKNWKSLYENSILGPPSFLSIISACIYTTKKTEEDYIFWGLIIKYYSLWDMLLDSNLIDLLLVKMKTFESGIFCEILLS